MSETWHVRGRGGQTRCGESNADGMALADPENIADARAHGRLCGACDAPPRRPPASRNVAGYVKRMRRVARLRERVERERARLRPLEDALRAALADAQIVRARLTGGQLADAARRLAPPTAPLADAPTRKEASDG